MFKELMHRSLLNPSKAIVDIGCGSSPHIGYHLHQNGYVGRVYFVDWNVEALRDHQDVFHGLEQ